VQHRAVTGQFVVLVEDVQGELAVAGPVVHRLERDQSQVSIDGQSGDLLALHAVRPPPQHLPVTQVGEIRRQGLGQQDDVTVGDEPLTGQQSGHLGCQLPVGDTEALTVALFEKDAPAQVRVDAPEVQRVDRQPPLMRLARTCHHPKAELIHPRTPFVGCPVVCGQRRAWPNLRRVGARRANPRRVRGLSETTASAIKTAADMGVQSAVDRFVSS
jgi:hypothetical protein